MKSDNYGERVTKKSRIMLLATLEVYEFLMQANTFLSL